MRIPALLTAPSTRVTSRPRPLRPLPRLRRRLLLRSTSTISPSSSRSQTPHRRLRRLPLRQCARLRPAARLRTIWTAISSARWPRGVFRRVSGKPRPQPPRPLLSRRRLTAPLRRLMEPISRPGSRRMWLRLRSWTRAWRSSCSAPPGLIRKFPASSPAHTWRKSPRPSARWRPSSTAASATRKSSCAGTPRWKRPRASVAAAVCSVVSFLAWRR